VYNPPEENKNVKLAEGETGARACNLKVIRQSGIGDPNGQVPGQGASVPEQRWRKLPLFKKSKEEGNGGSSKTRKENQGGSPEMKHAALNYASSPRTIL